MLLIKVLTNLPLTKDTSLQSFSRERLASFQAPELLDVIQKRWVGNLLEQNFVNSLATRIV